DIVKALNYNNTGTAWISDQIGMVIPAKISLTGLRIDPVARKKQKNTPFELEKIVVTGYSTDNASFGELVSALSGLGFVKEIDYQSYQYNKQSARGEFEIRLSYKTDVR
ncbi:MAG: hypothetical protein WBA74_24090, partial [Cyclobacteriaceae bacterium]